MKKKIFFVLLLILSLGLKAQTQINTLGNYVWHASDEPKTFNRKLQLSFVKYVDYGFPSYGTVLAGGGLHNSQDGGVFQLYFPYSEYYGGNAPKIRLGLYNNQGWSNWETFYTSANANKLNIDWKAKSLFANENIGIGTTSPKSKLDLGSDYSDPSIYPNKITLWSGGENNYFGFGISSSDLDYFSQGNHRFYTEYNGTPGSEKMVIKSNGNVGIGYENPDMKFSVYSRNKSVSRFHSFETSDAMTGIRIGRKLSTGATFADLVNLSDGFGISAGYSSNNLPLSTQNTDFIAIYANHSTKNVGIGTISPGTWKLAVNGKVRAKEVKVETGW